jgi:hypothetical protein
LFNGGGKQKNTEYDGDGGRRDAGDDEIRDKLFL